MIINKHKDINLTLVTCIPSHQQLMK